MQPVRQRDRPVGESMHHLDSEPAAIKSAAHDATGFSSEIYGEIDRHPVSLAGPFAGKEPTLPTGDPLVNNIRNAAYGVLVACVGALGVLMSAAPALAADEAAPRWWSM